MIRLSIDRLSLVVLRSTQLSIFAAALICTAAGQQGRIPATTFKSKAELVLVPVVVTRNGQTVNGLTAKDFILLRDESPEKVEVFEEIETQPVKVEATTLPPQTVQNYTIAERRQDIVILLLDFLNASWSTGARIRSYLGDMAQQFATSHTPVTVLLLSRDGLVQVHSFTTDIGNLTKAIEQWQRKMRLDVEYPRSWSTPVASTTESETLAALEGWTLPLAYHDQVKLDFTAMTLRAMEQLSEAFRGFPGRKKLIWMSIGFPMVSSVRDEFEVAGKRMRAWKALSDANFAVYPIDSNGVVNPSWENQFDVALPAPEWLGKVQREIPSNTHSLLEVAERTGGQVCTLIPTRCVERIQNDALHYYVLGFYLHGESKPGWNRLNVKVPGPHLQVRTRDGFMVGTAEAQESGTDTSKDMILTALASPLDYTSVPLRLHWSLVAAPEQEKERQIELVLSSPPGGIGIRDDMSIDVDFLVFVRPTGKTDGQTFPATLASKLTPAQQRNLATTGFLYRKQVVLSPARYEIRVLVRDNVAKKMGTVSTVLDLTTSLMEASHN